MSNHYLDIDGVISFKEFVMSMRKGSLNKQISDLANNEFPSLEQIGSLIIESVRVEIGDDCLKIIPEFTKSITISSDHEKDTFDEAPITQKQAPSVRSGSYVKYTATECCSVRKTKKRERRSQREKQTDLLNELKAKANEAEKTDCQKQISKRSKGCSNKHSIGILISTMPISSLFQGLDQKTKLRIKTKSIIYEND